ncbi:MAG TPA: lysylphosphatidylglycerol synthase transmembrane domain-containing protein [Bryobacteraceae bacterium]|nr:lysylphosphatidylglycerol synthase transmembrane domain-containing protein [Bryobacteraceae bacterium]
MSALRSGARVAVRILFGAAIVAWMVHSGKLDLARVRSSLAHWPLMLAILGLGYAQVAIATGRWNLLLGAQQIRLPYSRAWGLVMIGMVFNVVIPGAVGGDLVKGYYIAQAAGPRATHAATSVVMDRVAGLVGLLLLGALLVAIRWREVMHAAAMHRLALITVIGAPAGLAVLYAIVFAGARLADVRAMPGFARNIFHALADFRVPGSVIPAALLLSMANQAAGFAMYWLALRSTGAASIPLGPFFLAVPLGFIVNALPLSPGGIGVGQAGFFGLFHMVAPALAAQASDAMTVYQVMYFLVCGSGLFWYVSYRKPALREDNATLPSV